MTTHSRFRWRISFILLVMGGLLVAVFCAPQKFLPVVKRPLSDRNFLRVACAKLIPPDPQRRGSPMVQYNQFVLSLWEPLVECDPSTGQPQPAAAQSWAWSDDRLALTIALRRDGHWSNGDPVTAHDFVRGWMRLLKLDEEGNDILAPLKNARAYQRGEVTDEKAVGFHAVDDFTLRLELDKPRSTLVMELADPILSPLHVTGSEVLENKSYFLAPSLMITNGPFHLVCANQDGYRLESNKFYHDYSSVRLAGVQFVVADSMSVAQLMLAAGVIDLLVPTPLGYSRELCTQREISIKSELEPTVNSIDFNLDHWPLNDVRVRRALALALDRESPIQKYDQEHLVSAWSWVPEMPGRPGLKLLHEDADAARRLLAEAGFPGGQGFPVLRMAQSMDPRPKRFAAAWTERWFRELGIRTYVNYEYEKKHMRRMREGNYDVIFNRLTATVPDAGDLLCPFLWPSDFNRTNWRDDEVSRLLANANACTGAEHLAFLEQAERRAMSEVPCVPVMFERRQTMFAQEVHGWYSDPLSRQNLKRFYLEPES